MLLVVDEQALSTHHGVNTADLKTHIEAAFSAETSFQISRRSCKHLKGNGATLLEVRGEYDEIEKLGTLIAYCLSVRHQLQKQSEALVHCEG